jgi:hypothetical protein
MRAGDALVLELFWMDCLVAWAGHVEVTGRLVEVVGWRSHQEGRYMVVGQCHWRAYPEVRDLSVAKES